MTTDKQPAGTPASSASAASASAVNGVAEAGFSTTGQPAANAAAALRVIIAAGKFHGVIAATGPTGSWKARIKSCPLGLWMALPSRLWARLPNQLTKEFA